MYSRVLYEYEIYSDYRYEYSSYEYLYSFLGRVLYGIPYDLLMMLCGEASCGHTWTLTRNNV